MKAIITIALVLAAWDPCGRTELVEHSRFFRTHDAVESIKSLADAERIHVHSSGEGVWGGGAPNGQRSFYASAKGNQGLQKKLIDHYFEHVKLELEQLEATIASEGRWLSGSNQSGFMICYCYPEASGVVRVNSLIDLEDNIVLDVFIYEHK